MILSLYVDFDEGQSSLLDLEMCVLLQCKFAKYYK